MPLTAAGKKTLASMRKVYRSEKKAQSVFYAYLNKHKDKRATYEGKRK